MHASVRQGDYSVRIGESLFVVAEMVAAEDHTGCQVELASEVPVIVGYHFTEGQGGSRIGTANTPMDLKTRVPQALWLIVAPRALLDNSTIEFDFNCADGAQAPIVAGTNTLTLRINTPYIPGDPSNPIEREYRYRRGADEPRNCAPWPVEHIFSHFDNTLVVRLTAVSLSEVNSISDLSTATMKFDYEVEEVIRGSQRSISGIEGPVISTFTADNSVPPLGGRFIISGDVGTTVRWENCPAYWMVPVVEPGECQLYRYRRLAKKSYPFDQHCEAANIRSYLERLKKSGDQYVQTQDLEELKRLWQEASGHTWDGKEVPDKVLYRFRKNDG